MIEERFLEALIIFFIFIFSNLSYFRQTIEAFFQIHYFILRFVYFTPGKHMTAGPGYSTWDPRKQGEEIVFLFIFLFFFLILILFKHNSIRLFIYIPFLEVQQEARPRTRRSRTVTGPGPAVRCQTCPSTMRKCRPCPRDRVGPQFVIFCLVQFGDVLLLRS